MPTLEFDWRNQPRDSEGRWASTRGYFTGIKGGGKSINLRNGQVPSAGFAVGRTKGISMPESEAFDPQGNLSPAAIKKINKFILLRRRELFSKTVKHPVVLGLFHDTDNGVVDVDISDILPATTSPARVKALAAKRNQKSVYSLHDKETIDTGGTGDTRPITADAGSAPGELRQAERDRAGADSHNPITILQASAVQVQEMRFHVVQPLEFHGVNTHNEKAHGRRGIPDADISIKKPQRGGRIPAAKPTNKPQLKLHDPSKGVRIEFSLHNDKQKATVLAKVAKVPGFEDVEGMGVDEAEKVVRDRLSRNLEELFARSVEVYGLERTLEHAVWYPVAHEEGKKWAKEFGFEEDAVFAALAALSPNADWADNVAWARFIAQKVSNQENEVITQEVVDAFEAAQVVAYEGQLKKYESGKRPTKPSYPKPSGLPVGAKLSELDDEMAAKAIRGMGNHEVLMQDLFGNPETKASANSGLFISNAISILRNPSVENVDERLGKEHKVRSFYNNIREPFDTKYEDVTGDTHHFGAAFGHPWPGQSRFLASGKKGEENVNIWGGNKSGETGATGAYPLLVEATRQAAASINEKYKLDLRPNQIQSVVWEYHRNTWPSKARTEAVRASIEGVRTREAKGELTHAQAEELIEEIRVNAPTAAPKDKLLDQMLGLWKPGKRTRKRVV